MKKRKRFAIFSASLFSAALLCSGCADSASKDFTFIYDERTDGYILADYNGDGGTVTVPLEYKGKPVTEIERFAFVHRDENFEFLYNVDEIVLPNDLGFFPELSGVGGLKTVNIPKGVTELPDRALGSTAIQQFDIPDGITRVGEGAFERTPLTSINFADSVTELGESAFFDCKELTSVKLSQNLSEIPKNTFKQCTSLKEIDIPASVKKIGYDAFFGSSAEKITLPDGLETLDKRAFCGSNFKNIVIPDTVTEIGAEAFSGCTELETLILPKGITEIPEKCFFRCSSLKELVIPEGVTKIGKDAFLMGVGLNNDNVLADVWLPDSLSDFDPNDTWLYECNDYRCQIHISENSPLADFARTENERLEHRDITTWIIES